MNSHCLRTRPIQILSSRTQYPMGICVATCLRCSTNTSTQTYANHLPILVSDNVNTQFVLHSITSIVSLIPHLAVFFDQMSGRAGRRGFDIKGDVYFFGIPEVRIRQLMSSDLPQIQGNFPVTATCILRLMLMCSNGTDPADAVKRVYIIIITCH